MRCLPLIFLLILVVSCTQEGTLTVQNEAGPDLYVAVDGSSWILDDGASASTVIDVGRKFIFGPTEKLVIVDTEGPCKWPSSEVVPIRNREPAHLTVFADAGLIDVCNDTGASMTLYLVDCSSNTWGRSIDVIADGFCSLWQVDIGCWDLRVETADGVYEEFGIGVQPCDELVYTIEPAQFRQGPSKIDRPLGDETGLVAGRRELSRTRPVHQ
jgi:hypothetical protein